VQLEVFAAAALVASWLLTRQAPPCSAHWQGAKPVAHQRRRDLLLAGQGVLVGLLTGVAGVGGGFAIVPALVLLAGLPMPLASGTSLVLIAVNALVAFAALGHWPGAGLPLLAPLLLGGALGAVLGQRLGPRLKERRLRQAFAALLLGSALLSGGEALHRQQRGGEHSGGLGPAPSTSTTAQHPSRSTPPTQEIR
jgi:uncharacterized membrane protein YfcA